jgi:hypothetical protein
VDARKAALWRNRLEEYERLNPPEPSRRYSVEGAVSESFLDCLWDIEGVTGFTFMAGDKQFSVCYDPALIAPAQLDEKIRAAQISALPMT